jgi:signal peptidase I
VRETVESIVIAFVLAFLFRTFEAEAFVIPTGSMAPTLQGMHKDVECAQCGYRYRASASSEGEEQLAQVYSELNHVERELRAAEEGARRVQLEIRKAQLATEARDSDVVTATCPMCRYTMWVDRYPIPELRDDPEVAAGMEHESYNGDRILVSKFIYELGDPDRYDIVVFRYPGDAKTNYIKRMVGLPNESIRLEGGELHVRRPGEEGFQISRKPADKVWYMLHTVHDTDYQPKSLIERNWPLRWSIWPSEQGTNRWRTELVSDDAKTSRQVFEIEAGQPPAWVRYQHFVPSWDDWQQLRHGPLGPAEVAAIRPELITDFYAYNAGTMRKQGDRPELGQMGLHWVGDLGVDAQVQVQSDSGVVLLDVVEAGQHFRCRIDVATGQAEVTIPGVPGFSATAATPMRGPGAYRLTWANIDDQLLLWVDEELVTFESPAQYNAQQVFGHDGPLRPQSSDDDAGDLAPAGVGSDGAAVRVIRLRVLRDIYYIADKYDPRNFGHGGGGPITDYASRDVPMSANQLRQLLSTPAQWSAFSRRRSADFELGQGQYFVLGDNSPYSKDSRLWDTSPHYVERELLIGKALCIYWPHSWHRIPGTPIPFPYFPNFADMGFVH